MILKILYYQTMENKETQARSTSSMSPRNASVGEYCSNKKCIFPFLRTFFMDGLINQQRKRKCYQLSNLQCV